MALTSNPASDDDKLDQVEEDTQRVKGVGEIIVQVFRKSAGVKTNHRNNRPPRLGRIPKTFTSTVHEKALKGESQSHSTS